VIINITDHFTRGYTNVTDTAADRIFGVLFGVQDGLKVDIHTSFEIKYDIVDGQVVVDAAFVEQLNTMMVAVYPTYELLGWYSTGSEVLPEDLNTHRAVGVLMQCLRQTV
jgi:COP9 signalosome complex subunit 6